MTAKTSFGVTSGFLFLGLSLLASLLLIGGFLLLLFDEILAVLSRLLFLSCDVLFQVVGQPLRLSVCPPCLVFLLLLLLPGPLFGRVSALLLLGRVFLAPPFVRLGNFLPLALRLGVCCIRLPLLLPGQNPTYFVGSLPLFGLLLLLLPGQTPTCLVGSLLLLVRLLLLLPGQTPAYLISSLFLLGFTPLIHPGDVACCGQMRTHCRSGTRPCRSTPRLPCRPRSLRCLAHLMRQLLRRLGGGVELVDGGSGVALRPRLVFDENNFNFFGHFSTPRLGSRKRNVVRYAPHRGGVGQEDELQRHLAQL